MSDSRRDTEQLVEPAVAPDDEAAIIPDGEPPVPDVGSPPTERRPRGAHGAWGSALIFVVPYLVLMLAWALSNPPAASPDEQDHLVKAIGMAGFDIGEKYLGPPLGDGGIGQQRNASISRVITIPANLVPGGGAGGPGYLCEIFSPTTTASCLPTSATTSTAPEDVVVAVGSYPPFLYPPIGWMASLASTPTQAFLLARIFCALASSLLLLLGAAHLVQALGRRALLGAFVGLTPMVVFCGGSVTTSGLEICAAFATACIVVAALRRPATLAEPGTQLLLAGVGATLILSRQLGAVTFALMMLVLLVRLGPRFFWTLAVGRRPAFLSSVAVLLIAGISVAVWERLYDHPSMLGSAFSASALGLFGEQSYGVLRSGVAQFGWLDTMIPPWFVAAWIVLGLVVIGTAVVIGRRADRITLMVWSVLLLAIAYVTYATVFFPLGALLQGRHLLAFFVLLPLLSGVIVVERLTAAGPRIVARMFGWAAIIMPVLQAVSLYLNARRYAVGTQGPLWFLGHAVWAPAGGWILWLTLGLVGSGALAAAIRSSATEHRPAPSTVGGRQCGEVSRSQ